MTGYLCLGAAFGILLRTAGYGIGWSIAMSMICYCGSMQFVGVSLLTAAFDPFQALLMSVMVNARHAFYGLSMLEKYRGTGPVRPVLICTLTDETFSLVSTLEPPEGVARRDFYFWISLLDYLYWQVGCTLGNAVGGLLTFDTTGLDFTLTALFIVLLLEQVKKKENRAAGIIGMVCTAASLAVFGPDNFLIPAMILLLAVLTGREEKTVQMTSVQALITILAIAAGTQFTRWLPFWLFPEKKDPPAVVLYLGKVLPPAMMGLLTVYCFKNVAWLSGTHGAPELLASAAVVGLHLWKRNVLFSIAGGTALYMVLVQAVFA